jgi:hypothetical protein
MTNLVVNQFPRLVVDDENFKNAEASAVAGVVAIAAAPAFLHRRGLQVLRRDVQRAHFLSVGW